MKAQHIKRQKAIKKAVAFLLVVLLGVAVLLICAGKFGWYDLLIKPEDADATSGLVIKNDTQWHYMDSGMEPGIGNVWTTEKYNSVHWKKSAGVFKNSYQTFNVKDIPAITLQVPDGINNSAPTYFFRTKFNVKNKDNFNYMEGLIHYSDAFIVYLNGEIISAGNVPSGGYASNQDSKVAENLDGVQSTKFTVTDLWPLKEGENILSVELHQGDDKDVDAFFYFEYLQMHEEEITEIVPTLTHMTLQPGTDETSMGVSWVTDSADYYQVKYIEAAAYTQNMQENDFLAKSTGVIMGRTQITTTGQYLHVAQLDRLKTNTKYIYKIVKLGGKTVSEPLEFQTSERKIFSFAALGDPQLGAYQANDATRWQTSIDNIQKTIGKTDFIVSVGDQVDGIGETSFIDKCYKDFRMPQLLKQTPVYTVRGNHESQGDAKDIYTQQFKYPNSDEKGNNWFTYQTALIVGIDSNNYDVEYHKQFIKNAIDTAKGRWVIVVMHHSLFGEGTHKNDTEVLDMQQEYADMFKELNVDLVLSGHEHIYSRSYLMNGTQPISDTDRNTKNIGETLYLTLGSSSGNKFYKMAEEPTKYTAFKDITDNSFVSVITVQQSGINIKTYQTQDSTLLDEYTLKKN